MSVFSGLEARFKALVDELVAAAHPLATEASQIFSQLKDAEGKVGTEAVGDAEQVAKDAEAAAKPVVAEAEADVKQVATDAVTAAEGAVEGGKKQ